MKQTVALVGNPNSGKTTLFNLLTGSKQHVGNWPGVTIDKKEGYFTVEEHDITLVDLPGIYSMSPFSLEEIVSRDFIMKEHPNLIINIIDGTNLERNLYLSLQLKELGLPMVIAINMLDELESKNIKIDIKKLSKLLNTPVVGISAKSGDGVKDLIHSLIHDTYSSTFMYDDVTEKHLKQITSLIKEVNHDPVHEKFYAFKLLEDDEILIKDFKFNQEQFKRLYDIQESFTQSKNQKDIDMAVADTRYLVIENIIKQCVNKEKNIDDITYRIDKLLLHKYLGIPMFFIILLIMFLTTFGPIGEYLMSIVENIIGNIAQYTNMFLVDNNASIWVVSLVDTIINGVGAVLSFMPQIMILFLFLSILEDSGYMSRAAFLMDQLLRKIGLNGKAFIPMLMGLGCTVPALMATRVLETEDDKKMTMVLTPFMSCGARLPIYALMAGIFFPNYAGIVIFSMYLLGLLVIIISGLFLKKFVFKNSGSTFILELPPYRLPSLKSTLIHMWEKAKGFMVKAGTVILIATVVLWVLTTFNFSLNMVDNTYESIIGVIGKSLEWIFIPTGFGNWEAVISLIFGFVAKESIVSSMAVVYGASTGSELSHILLSMYTNVQAYAFMAFALLYSPCVAAVSTLYKESDSIKFTIKSVIFQTGVAWLVATIINIVGSLII